MKYDNQEMINYYIQNSKIIEYELDRIEREVRHLLERKAMMLKIKAYLENNMKELEKENQARQLKKVI